MQFGTTRALDALDLEVGTSRIVAIMGPSGCGKSTLLRVIAGLQHPDLGTVAWQGNEITSVPTHERGFGLMFQDYALFPHRSVAANVGFGLRMANWDAAAITGRVADMLDVVGLAGYGDRTIDGLSGGEQQRVALARTLAPQPRLVMLDEPLGSLDRTLRTRLVAEMRDTFAHLGVTAIYVTHDQDEAFTMGEEVAVMERGAITTRGTAHELWSNPQTASVARLIGHDNVFSATEAARVGFAGLAEGSALVIAADRITPSANPAGDGTVVAVGLREGRQRVEVMVDDVRLIATHPAPVATGDAVDLSIPPDAVTVLAG